MRLSTSGGSSKKTGAMTSKIIEDILNGATVRGRRSCSKYTIYNVVIMVTKS